MHAKRLLFALPLLAAALIGLSLSVFAQDAYRAPFVSHDDLRLTIYSDGSTIVRDSRTFQLEAGLNALDFVGVPAQINPATAVLAPGNPADAITIIGQQYRHAPLSNTNLLAQHIGKLIELVNWEGVAYRGTLLSANGTSYILETDEGTIVSLDEGRIIEFRFTEMPDDLTPMPTLRFLVRVDEAGEYAFDMTYLTTGLRWASHYNLSLAADNASVDFNGWLAVDNNASATFENAQVAIAAADSDQIQFAFADQAQAAFAATATPPPTATPPFGAGGPITPDQTDEWVIPLPHRLTLRPNETQYLEFLADTTIEAQNQFVYDASPRVFGYSGFITNPTYGITQVAGVQNYLRFTTQEDGLDLPAGIARIVQTNEDGVNLRVGETALRTTPAGQTTQIFLENADDLEGERLQSGFQLLSDRAVQETYEIRIRNNSDEAVTVLIPERMTRGATWEIISSSVPFEQPDDFGVEFELAVPAGEIASLSYTVLYTRAQ